MDTPTTQPASQSKGSLAEASVDALTQEGQVSFQITTNSQCGYSVLVRGDLKASSILSTIPPTETITVLENNTRLLSGSVSGETAGFVLTGQIVAMEFDDPDPEVRVDGSLIDPTQWPTVKEYTGHGPHQEAVEDPFPESGELGGSPGDPLKPDEYVIELGAANEGETEAYCFDIDGEIIDRSDSVTVSETEDRVYGCLAPGDSAQVEVRGVVTRAETAQGIDFTVRIRENAQPF